MSNTLITINDSFTLAQLQSLLFPNGSTDSHNFVTNFKTYLSGMSGKQWAQGCLIKVDLGAAYAAGTLTVSSTGSTAAETFTLLNVVFTARASGAGANEFNISSTPATQATNMKNAINASSSVNTKVIATSALGVVTITSLEPGNEGNGLQLSEALTNVVAAAFSGGSDGTEYSFDLR